MTRDVLDIVTAWRAGGRRVAVSTVVATRGSSPRRPGSVLAVCDNGRIEGSVSAGCIDGAAAYAAQQALADGRARLLAFGGAQLGDVWDIELPCGGEAQILVEVPDDAELACAREARAQGRPYVRVVELGGRMAGGMDDAGLPEDGNTSGVPLDARSRTFAEGEVEQGAGALDARIAARALARFDHVAHIAADPDPAGVVEFDDARYFVQRCVPAPRLVCVGATHIAQVLVELASAIGWRTAVVDPRAAFATPTRFPQAGEVVAGWPQRALPGLGIDADTAVCALSHDEKIDLPALDAALDTPAFFIGCLGRPSTQLERREALLAQGRTAGELARVHGPIGIWTGGRRPEDIALSAMGQMAAARNGTLGRLGAASDRRLADMDEDYVRAYGARARLRGRS